MFSMLNLKLDMTIITMLDPLDTTSLCHNLCNSLGEISKINGNEGAKAATGQIPPGYFAALQLEGVYYHVAHAVLLFLGAAALWPTFVFQLLAFLVPLIIADVLF